MSLKRSSRVDAEPLVSVVIPTCRRPHLVMRAVRSALTQTLEQIEVIVVPADSDEETHQVLSRATDKRLRVVPYERPLTAAEARNRGVRAARGEWVAFLDDDDLWLPPKLKRQIEVAAASPHPQPVVSCGVLAQDGRSEFLWPRRLPDASEPIGDYLFRRRSLFGGGGYIQTSTLLARRELFLKMPFREDLQRGEDLDWLLRTGQEKGVKVEFVVDAEGNRPEPLAVWSIDEGRPRASYLGSWRDELEWIRASRALVSPEAYASYLLTWVSFAAVRQKAGLRDFWGLLCEAVRDGAPSPLDAMVHVGHWLVPHAGLRRISGLVTGKRLGSDANGSRRLQ